MNKRYQVFVSSTYADLKEERAKVIQTIMELDCIPAGMEIFPAIDEEQFNFIKRIIDDCDYYLLIVGGRYGSISEDGLSYTEKEYDYAIEKNIKVVAFIHEHPESIPLGKSEKDQLLRDKLNKFKSKVSANRLVKFWNNAEELPGLVALSLSKTIKTYPTVGWIRGTAGSNVELLQELNEQRKVNEELNQKIQQYEKERNVESNTASLADLDDTFKIFGTVLGGRGRYSWEIELTWQEIFELISPYILEVPNEILMPSLVSRVIFEKTGKTGTTSSLDSQIYQTIKIQLTALGLIENPIFKNRERW